MDLLIIAVCIVICAEMWRKGGDGQSLYRNPLVPAIIAVSKFIMLEYNWWALLYIPLLWGAIQAFSYGLDAPIHNFYERVFHCGSKGNAPFVEMSTRATCGFLWSLPAILFAVLTGHWVAWVVYSIVLTIGNGLVGGLVKDVEISERGVGFLVALGVII